MSARKAIEAGGRALGDALNAKDAAAAAACYTENATVFPPDVEAANGRAAIQAFWQSMIDAGIADARLTTIELDEFGDSAAEVGMATGSMPDSGGGRADFTAKFVVIWKKDADGAWRMHRDIWNFNA